MLVHHLVIGIGSRVCKRQLRLGFDSRCQRAQTLPRKIDRLEGVLEGGVQRSCM